MSKNISLQRHTALKKKRYNKFSIIICLASCKKQPASLNYLQWFDFTVKKNSFKDTVTPHRLPPPPPPVLCINEVFICRKKFQSLRQTNNLRVNCWVSKQCMFEAFHTAVFDRPQQSEKRHQSLGLVLWGICIVWVTLTVQRRQWSLCVQLFSRDDYSTGYLPKDLQSSVLNRRQSFFYKTHKTMIANIA